MWNTTILIQDTLSWVWDAYCIRNIAKKSIEIKWNTKKATQKKLGEEEQRVAGQIENNGMADLHSTMSIIAFNVNGPNNLIKWWNG